MKRHEQAARMFGYQLRLLREKKGLTQQQLADDSALDIRTIQRLENGEVGAGLHSVFAIAEALSVLPEDLFKKLG